MGLRWSQVDWVNNRFTFVDSKRKGKEQNGKKRPNERTVPLFPALRVELETLYKRDRAMNSEFVINRYRDPKTNLGTQFARISKAAGLDKIPRPFDNMRASRATEINAEFDDSIEEAWLGHSKKIARQHYLMVRQGDYSRAAKLELTQHTYQ